MSTTNPDCPAWCGQPAGHPFTPPEFDGDDPSRIHQRIVGDRASGHRRRFSVLVEAYETRRRSWQAERTPATITLYEQAGNGRWAVEDLTVEDARWLAGVLVAAADVLEAGR